MEEIKSEVKEENKAEVQNNCIYIGSKRTVNYLNYALTQFLNAETKEVILKARGNMIPKAIYVACILKSYHIKDLQFRTEIGSELLDNNHVPNIKIHASKFACVI